MLISSFTATPSFSSSHVLLPSPISSLSPLSGNLSINRPKGHLGFVQKLNNNTEIGIRVVVARCKGGHEEGEEGWCLEQDLLEFMENSEKTESFPTRGELVEAGRMDLVEGIQKQGGWLCLGWDLDEDVHEDEDVFTACVATTHTTVHWEYVNAKENEYEKNAADFEMESSSSASSSETEDDTGIQGILNGLDKQRDKMFGSGLRRKEKSNCVSITNGVEELKPHFLRNETVVSHDRSNISQLASIGKSKVNDSRFEHSSQGKCFLGRSSSKVGMWRDWSMQRAGFSDADFEAAEIDFYKREDADATEHEIFEIYNKPLDRRKELINDEEIDCNNIRTRLGDLESELSTALRSLKTKTDKPSPEQSQTSRELLKVSDAWEFQENEIMSAQNRLRSIRAKLAVVEGKMALAIINAQKVVEEKQKRIDDTRQALLILRTACVVWPNPASEVFLAGSFDGWSSQRRMEKSNTGIFSVYLKLYSGRHQIKFIVDGQWKIDPLRPVVHDNGFVNNLLVVS